MRSAHTFPLLALAASMAAASPAWAQSPAPAVASDATAAVQPLLHTPLPASGNVETAQTDWRGAHEAVAAFPRGHADIAAWEAAQARGTIPRPAPKPAMPEPHLGHHGAQP